ncbi:hypothetical protein VNO80_27029 [Phaseolus coccineus]|uniref:Uncharacterized protein n=1 Tax=Phaseolus coccineus TaxID=3886 RepID=A0AAN9QH91_PHACN
MPACLSRPGDVRIPRALAMSAYLAPWRCLFMAYTAASTRGAQAEEENEAAEELAAAANEAGPSCAKF